MVGTGQDCLAPEAPDGLSDAIVVGGDRKIIEPFGLGRLLVDVLDHRLAGRVDEGLAGKPC
jgi:hypothetical protein